jgi:hypothetical protein
MKREKKGKDILIKTKPGAGDGSSKEAQEVGESTVGMCMCWAWLI